MTWIRWTKQKPKLGEPAYDGLRKSERVLLWNVEDNEIQIGEYFRTPWNGGSIVTCKDMYDTKQIRKTFTYWKPLPKPPKELQ